VTGTRLRLGYVPLLDAAPLIVAQTLGFGDEEGLDLILDAAPSWSALRDMLAFGQVEAAQMLAPVPVAMALGLGGSAARFEALSVLNANGDVIGVSRALSDRMQDQGWTHGHPDARETARALLAAADRCLRVGVPFPFSMHSELVRYWLEGLDGLLPAKIDMRTVPPPRMAEALAAGEIDVFCVGEPWGSVAVERGVGALLLPGTAIWAFAPEKVLAVRAGWADADPDTAGRLMRAVWRAGRWLGEPQNRMMASEILAMPDHLDLPAEMIERVLEGRLTMTLGKEDLHAPHLIEFFAGAATFPWRSQAAWIGARLARRYGLDPETSATAARDVFRSDLYRHHLRSAGADLPGASEKVEGALAVPSPVASERGQMILAADRFFDARVFDPADPLR
jgi:two-component system, oxyanion-binding sensor